MPQAAPHVCAGAGCRTTVPHGERWCPPCRAQYDARDRERRGSARARGYDSRWERARRPYLARNPLCRACMEWGRVTPATVVDHIVPHRGDQKLFWDEANWQPLCKPCHDFKTATEDGTGSDAVRPSRLRPSRVPLVVVAGPPGAGKSTWVRERAGAGDLVLDLDEIRARLSGLPLYAAGDEWRARALRWRNERLLRLSMPDPPWARAWLIVTAPHPADRLYWREQGGGRVVVLETPVVECVRRIAADVRRGALATHHASVARSWWSTYRPDEADERVGPTTPASRVTFADLGVRTDPPTGQGVNG